MASRAAVMVPYPELTMVSLIGRVVIFAGGSLDSGCLDTLKASDYIIGVDAAALWLIDHGITPELAIGDFDSVTPEGFARISQKSVKVLSYRPEKDATDTELALTEGMKLHPAQILIYGGIGTRMDHTLANIYLLESRIGTATQVTIHDGKNRIHLVSESMALTADTGFPFVSVLPLSRKAVITLTGFKYPATRKAFIRGRTLGISNEITSGSARITVHSGKALVIRSRD